VNTSPHSDLLPTSTPLGIVSLLDEAWRLERFAAPFTFGEFFSPEDTLLCVCAADAARELLTAPAASNASADHSLRVAELTSGSGLVGLYLLGRDSNARLLGLDINEEAAHLAERNALILGLADRARFAQADLWSPSTFRLLEVENPQMIVCNPPYVPEPLGTRMQIEAGAGPNGTAHLLRAIELTELVQPDTLALSWCSLSDPAGIADAAEASGYELCELFVTAIADGEYSGSVHSYLGDLADCFINEQSETLAILAPDGSARFAYLLLAGVFVRGGGRREAGGETRKARRGRREARSKAKTDAAAAVRKICVDFSQNGVPSLTAANAPFPLHCSILNRWDELKLRVILHGEVARTLPPPASRLPRPAT
jgi:hypothetical protein